MKAYLGDGVMENLVELQQQYCSRFDEKRLCSFDYEILEEKLRPILHQEARFLFVNKGNGKIKINESEYEIKDNTIISILPWDYTEITEVSETIQLYRIIYNHVVINDVIKSLFNVANELVPTSTKIKEHPVIYCTKETTGLIKDSFLKIRDEVGIESVMEVPKEKVFRNVYIVSLLVELLIHICRAGEIEKETIGVTPKEEKRNLIFKYIYMHLSEKLTIGKLAKLFYMSESSVSKYIMDTTGLTFNNLVNEMRVVRTFNYLLYTEYTLEELANLLGYVDAAHISKVFESRTENKISEYRKTYQTVLAVCNINERKMGYHVVSYIADNYKEEITATSVAMKFGITVSELNRIVFLYVEKNFFNFLNFLRINASCKLLATTSMTITEIAIEVGYNTVKTYTRNFVHLKEVTPKNYRKKVKMEPSKELEGIGE